MGEWIGGDMIKYKDGDILKWPWSIQNPVSYSMDTEISASYPKSWHKKIPGKAFSEDCKNNAGMQDNRIQYNEGPHTHGNDDSTKICSQ